MPRRQSWAVFLSRNRFLTNDKMNHILDYERATHIVEEAEYIGLGLCYCRHKMSHAGHPVRLTRPGMCLTLTMWPVHWRSMEITPAYLQGGGTGCLERSYASNLVQIGGKCPGAPCIYLQLLRMLL